MPNNALKLAQCYNWVQAAQHLAQDPRLADAALPLMGSLGPCSPQQPWCVACSGGPDSLALLLVAWAKAWHPQRSYHVLHYDHRSRAGASGHDAAFVQHVCAALAVPCTVGVAAQAKPCAKEADWRRERMHFFHTTMAALGARVLLLGHQADDVLESLLMRLFRCNGSEGLAAPQPLVALGPGRLHVRPWLGLPKELLTQSLAKLSIPWCHDSSNDNPRVGLRNALRQQVIPALQALMPQANLPKAAGHTRQCLQDEHEALEAWLAKLLPRELLHAGCWEALSGKPKALWRRALQHYLQHHGLHRHVTLAAKEALLEALFRGHSGHLLSVGSGVLRLTRSYHVEFDPQRARPSLPHAAWPAFSLVVGAQAVCVPLGVQGQYGWLGAQVLPYVPGGPLAQALPGWQGILVQALGHTPPPAGPSRRPSLADPSADLVPLVGACLGLTLQGPLRLSVRSWQCGDVYTPLGLRGHKKLQDAFVDAKIPASLRRVLPFVCQAPGSILWVPGLVPSCIGQVGVATTHVLQLTYCLNSAMIPSSLPYDEFKKASQA
jgi:tRNA(Ile)-lysidine synthase